MINLIFSLLLSLLFSSNIFSQTITFDRDYYQFKDTDGYIIEETTGGDFIIGGVKGSNLLIVKTDDRGEIKFSREIATNNEIQSLRTFPVHTTQDGGFIVTTGIFGEGFTDLYLAKFDSSGNTVWENTFMDTVSVLGSDVVETDEGDFLVIGSVERNVVQILKTDADGNKIWSKLIRFNPTSSLLVGPMITKLSDNNYLIGNDRILQKISADGDSLWRINAGFKISIIKSTVESRIIAAGYRKFAVINLDGIIEFTQSLNFTVDSGDYSKDGGYIFLSDENHLTKTDPLGNILWEKDILKTGNYVSSTLDGGFVLTGNFSDKLRLLKTDPDGEFSTVYILNQDSYTTLAIFEKFTINWYSSGIEYVNIEYTIDSGSNWIEIVSNYPADSNKYDWIVPNTPSTNCKLRISSSEDNTVFHSSDSVFTLMMIQNFDYISVNECFMWIGNDGTGSHDPNSDGSGFYWPGGRDALLPAIFQDGLVWGGKIGEDIRVNGNTYRAGLKPGAILPNGKPDDPNKSKYKIFKINKNWQLLPDGGIKDRLEYDYNNWPGELGAPYSDINGDGEFSKGTDIPKFIGDEVLFYVANDADSATAAFPYDAKPMGLEFQTTVFGFDRDDVIKNVVFKKYFIINKSENIIEDMYISYWADIDLGFPGDDFVGCDTTLNLAYGYNGDEDDEGYYGSPPPAVGHLLLQGPWKIVSDGDSSWTGHMPVIRDLPMTAFSLYICGCVGCFFGCPGFGYDGALQIYNNMQGMYDINEPYIDLLTNSATPFCVPGDPVSQTGWYEGEGWPGGPNSSDRYYMLSSGPFNLEPGESQEVIIAIMMAQGEDRLNSISRLRGTARNTIEFYKSGFSPDFVTEVKTVSREIPNDFLLSQNYPNPFNPSTVIRYQIPTSSVILSQQSRSQHIKNSKIPKEVRDDILKVSLKIFDILGREIATLVNQKQKPGNYEFIFNGGSYASGMYFYRLKAGDFVDVKKMMLLK